MKVGLMVEIGVRVQNALMLKEKKRLFEIHVVKIRFQYKRTCIIRIV